MRVSRRWILWAHGPCADSGAEKFPTSTRLVELAEAPPGKGSIEITDPGLLRELLDVAELYGRGSATEDMGPWWIGEQRRVVREAREAIDGEPLGRPKAGPKAGPCRPSATPEAGPEAGPCVPKAGPCVPSAIDCRPAAATMRPIMRGDQLKKYLADHVLTYADVAEALGVTERTVKRYVAARGVAGEPPKVPLWFEYALRYVVEVKGR